MEKDCKYYYNIKDSSILKNMLYEDALNYKIQEAKKLIKELQIPHYTDRDDHRIDDVLSAISFNQKLLNE